MPPVEIDPERQNKKDQSGKLGEPGAGPPNASLRQVLGAVFWSFLGIRRGAAMSQDIGTIKPVQVIIVGIALAAILVVFLVVLVHIIIRST